MIHRLAQAIGYPETVPEGVHTYAFRVDGDVYTAEQLGARCVIRRRFQVEDATLLRLASFTAGRLLREDAVLAWDDHSQELELWQEIPMGRAPEMAAAFGAFVNACEWWMARVAEEEIPRSVFPEMMIQP